jgi:hypothetical protein
MALRTPRHAIACSVAALAAVVLAVLPSTQVVHADAAPVGAVLVAGSAWAGADASLGNLNVYSNGPTFTGPYQCTELVMRWAAVRYSEPAVWPAAHSAADMWNAGPSMPVPFMQLPNGGGVLPQYGDILVFNVTPTFASGHVAVVTSVASGHVNFVEENGSWTGRGSMPIYGSTMPPRAGSNQPVIGWLRASSASYTPTAGSPGGQILDSYGGLHAFGSSAPVTQYPYWNGWDIARDVALQPGHLESGYTLDGWGGLHPFGGAPEVQSTGYWPGWDIARRLVLRADGVSGYVLDGWGGLHPFGVAGDMPPTVQVGGYWRGWDIAHAVTLRSDGTSGYVLDGFGGLHPFAAAPGDTPPNVTTAYWNGWDIARAVTLSSDTGGYVLDGFGGVHAFGDAAPMQISGYFNADVARGIMMTSARGGYVLFRTGVVRPFGDAPTANMQLMGLPLGRAVD